MRLARLAKKQAHYRPSRKVAEKLSDKTLIMLVSATSMGKSTIMRGLHDHFNEISVVGTITSRPPRVDDDLSRYTFYDHTDRGLRPILDAIEKGEVVQYVINPYSGFVYGSSLQDYPSVVNIGDYFSSVVDTFYTYGFQKILPISIITEPNSWLNRFNARFPMGSPDRGARRDEAITSLLWSLGRQDLLWVINRDGESIAAINSLKNSIDDNIDYAEQTEAIRLAKACLKTIRETA